MKPEIIVVGASLGGLQALAKLLGGLGAQFAVPIAVVQHRAKSRRDMLVAVMQKHTILSVKEAEDRERLESSSVYVAPADYHLLIERGYCALSLEPPVSYARPSIDVLFESAAGTYGPAVIGVVLTGNNMDGAQGAAHIKAAGGMVIVQDPSECESSSMPLATMARAPVDHVLKLADMAPFLLAHCRPDKSG